MEIFFSLQIKTQNTAKTVCLCLGDERKMMSRDEFTKLIFALFIVVLIIGTYATYIEFHEGAHEEIAKFYGCEVEERTFMQHSTTFICDAGELGERYWEMEKLQSQNEIIGYNIGAPITYGVMSLIALIGAIVLINWRYKNE